MIEHFNRLTPAQIEIDAGQRFERRNPDGTLEPLTVQEIAAGAFRSGGRIMAPCITWEKQYPGQVTAGRIGRPVVRYCPLAWHGQGRQSAVLAELENKNDWAF